MSGRSAIRGSVATEHTSEATNRSLAGVNSPGGSSEFAFDSLPVRVYTSGSPLRNPKHLLAEMFYEIFTSRELAWRLFVRDLSAAYRQTWFGYVWAFLPPLANALTFVFLNSQGLFQTGATPLPFAAFAMIGTLLWQVFVDALNSPTASLLQAKPMLTKINFPREALLIAGLQMVLFNFAIRLILLTCVILWFRVPITPWILLAPVGVAALISCGFAVGLAVAPLGCLYGDIGKALPMITTFWMLLTPVVYPAKTIGLAGALTTWNPMSPVIITTRQFLTGETPDYLIPFFLVLAGSLLVALCGLIAFRLAMPHLIARLGG